MLLLRRALAILCGYIAWSALWLGYGALLQMLAVLPADPTLAIQRNATLVALLSGSVTASLMAGFITGMIDRTNSYRSAVWLGCALLATGIFVQVQYWGLMPLWYHLSFLGLLLPMSLGGMHLSRWR